MILFYKKTVENYMISEIVHDLNGFGYRQEQWRDASNNDMHMYYNDVKDGFLKTRYTHRQR